MSFTRRIALVLLGLAVCGLAVVLGHFVHEWIRAEMAKSGISPYPGLVLLISIIATIFGVFAWVCGLFRAYWPDEYQEPVGEILYSSVGGAIGLYVFSAITGPVAGTNLWQWVPVFVIAFLFAFLPLYLVIHNIVTDAEYSIKRWRQRKIVAA